MRLTSAMSRIPKSQRARRRVKGSARFHLHERGGRTGYLDLPQLSSNKDDSAGRGQRQAFNCAGVRLAAEVDVEFAVRYG